MYNDDFLQKKLNERRETNTFRSMRLSEGKIDFCSNDYLGIVKNNLLDQPKPDNRQPVTGSTGSRLLTGNYPFIEEVEKEIAIFHEAETALIFNSGYDANVGVLSSVPQKDDAVIYDQLSHASIRDGVRLSFAQSFSFLHNDLYDLEKKLQHASAYTHTNIFVVTETIFSMDGDISPLKEITDLCDKYSAHVIVDEAHATGLTGDRGEGLVQSLALQDKIFCRMHTFGKACGCHGAAVLGSRQLKDWLVNFARSFIYTTALPEQAVAAIQQSYAIFPGMHDERKHLNELIQYFKACQLKYEKVASSTHVQAVIIPGNEEVKNAAKYFQQNNLDVRPIVYPTVPKGKERLRILLHAFNTKEEVELLTSFLQ